MTTESERDSPYPRSAGRPTPERLPGGSEAQIARRIRLPADQRAPAAARDLARAVLREAGLSDLVDDAVLLITELTTNGVLHARTELAVEVVAERDGVTVTVTDYAGTASPLALVPGTAPTALQEHGRGLHLVDALSAAWGTVRERTAKSVWFRLGGHNTRTTPRGAEPPHPYRQDQLTWLADVAVGETPGQLTEILRRLCATLGANGAIVSVDQGDGTPRTWASCGAVPSPTDPAARLSLRLSAPWRGELAVLPADADAAGLLALSADRIALIIENHRLREAGVRQGEWHSFLVEAGELLAQSLDVDLTTALVPQLVVPRLGQWCAVHTLDPQGQPVLAALAHADETLQPRVRELMERARSGGVDLWTAAGASDRLPLDPPLEGITLPLTARGQRIGLLTIGRPAERRHGLDEITVAEDLARRAALALDHARAHDNQRRVAYTLQASLLPPSLPVVEGIGFGAVYVPTGRGTVGGDFYDVVPLADGGWLVVIGDVSGKGVSAAVVTGLVREVLRVLIRDGKPVTDTLHRLNETLAERGAGHFCTLALATVARKEPDVLTVALHLAGHEPPVLLRADGTATLVGTYGTALGLLPTSTCERADLTLDPGDALIFYTDGVTERRRGQELFGPRRLRTAASGLAGLPADAIAAGIRAAALGFSAESPRDDIAILALRNDC